MPTNNLTPQSDDWMIDDSPDVAIDTTAERRIGRLSRSKAWKEVNGYIEDRVAAYQSYIPGTNPAVKGTNADWLVADSIIKELRQLQHYVDTIAHGLPSDS